MKILITVFVICSLTALGQDARQSVVLKSKEKATKVLGVAVKEVIITGTQQEIMNSLIGTEAWIIDPSCSNLLLSKQQIFKSLTRTDEPPNCFNKPGLCVTLPNGFDFMGVYQQREWNKESCKVESICLTAEGAEFAISCGDVSVTLATSGKIQLSTTEGKVTRSVSIGGKE
jgi:hypothetical protein